MVAVARRPDLGTIGCASCVGNALGLGQKYPMMNPSTAVAVEGITTALTPQQVRLLFDVFTCIPEQLADIARSCGAIGTRPFCQMFHSYQKPTADDQECSMQNDIGKWSRFPQGASRRSYGAIDLEDGDI